MDLSSLILFHLIVLITTITDTLLNDTKTTNFSSATSSNKSKTATVFPSSFRFRNNKKLFHSADRNVLLYTIRQIYDKNFYDPDDYVINEKELITNDDKDYGKIRVPTMAYQKKYVF